MIVNTVLVDIYTSLPALGDSGNGRDSFMCSHVLLKPSTTAALTLHAEPTLLSCL